MSSTTPSAAASAFAKPTTPMPLDQLLSASTGSIDLDDGGECKDYNQYGLYETNMREDRNYRVRDHT